MHCASFHPFWPVGWNLRALALATSLSLASSDDKTRESSSALKPACLIISSATPSLKTVLNTSTSFSLSKNSLFVLETLSAARFKTSPNSTSLHKSSSISKLEKVSPGSNFIILDRLNTHMPESPNLVNRTSPHSLCISSPFLNSFASARTLVPDSFDKSAPPHSIGASEGTSLVTV